MRHSYQFLTLNHLQFLELQLWDQEKLEEWQHQQMEADEEKRREFMQVGFIDNDPTLS